MTLTLSFPVANTTALPSETQAEIRTLVMDALSQFSQGLDPESPTDQRQLAIIEALLHEDQNGTLPE